MSGVLAALGNMFNIQIVPGKYLEYNVFQIKIIQIVSNLNLTNTPY